MSDEEALHFYWGVRGWVGHDALYLNSELSRGPGAVFYWFLPLVRQADSEKAGEQGEVGGEGDKILFPAACTDLDLTNML